MSGDLQRARELAERLRSAARTASNDDLSMRGTVDRTRHVERVSAMLDAAEFLDGRTS